MIQTTEKSKIVWIKTSVYIELGLILAGTLATTVMLVSLLAEVVQASSLENSTFSPGRQFR